MKWNLDDTLDVRFEDGIEQGEERKVESIAIKMLCKGKSFEEISKCTDLNIQQLKELAKSNYRITNTRSKTLFAIIVDWSFILIKDSIVDSLLTFILHSLDCMTVY